MILRVFAGAKQPSHPGLEITKSQDSKESYLTLTSATKPQLDRPSAFRKSPSTKSFGKNTITFNSMDL